MVLPARAVLWWIEPPSANLWRESAFHQDGHLARGWPAVPEPIAVKTRCPRQSSGEPGARGPYPWPMMRAVPYRAALEMAEHELDRLAGGLDTPVGGLGQASDAAILVRWIEVSPALRLEM